MIDRLELTTTLEPIQIEIIQGMISMYRQEIPFKPLAVEAVKWAADRYPVALTSGSLPQLIEIVTQCEALRGSFDLIVSGDEIGVSKPDPAIYLATAKRLGSKLEKHLCIEDSLFGVKEGRRANMYVINIPNPNFPLPEEEKKQVDLILASLGEVSDEVIKQLEVLR